MPNHYAMISQAMAGFPAQMQGAMGEIGTGLRNMAQDRTGRAVYNADRQYAMGRDEQAERMFNTGLENKSQNLSQMLAAIFGGGAPGGAQGGFNTDFGDMWTNSRNRTRTAAKTPTGMPAGAQARMMPQQIEQLQQMMASAQQRQFGDLDIAGMMGQQRFQRGAQGMATGAINRGAIDNLRLMGRFV